MPRLSAALGLTIVSLLLQGCALPQGAGIATQVMAGAEAPDANFAVEFVTAANLDRLQSWPGVGDPNAASGWIGHKGGPASQIIEAGDTLDLTVFNNEENSLLTTPGQKQLAIPALTVAPDGTVFLPYADKVYVAKMTSDQAREAIQKGLAGVIPSAQVQLTVTSGRRNVVELISGVGSPGSYPMPDQNFSVLSLLAQGGGASANLVNPQVRLSREGKLYGVSLERLLANPSLDTTLRGGDKVYVEAEKRYFLSLGAAKNEAQIKFPQTRVTALDAMSLIGGFNDSTADPKGILILREYDDSAVRSDGSGPSRQRMIFAFDLTTADGLFSAGDFSILHQDLVLVTESPIISARSAIGFILQALGLPAAIQKL